MAVKQVNDKPYVVTNSYLWGMCVAHQKKISAFGRKLSKKEVDNMKIATKVTAF